MQSSSHKLYVILCAIFITALVVADIIGGRLFTLGPLQMGLLGLTVPAVLLSSGIIPFPVTFLLTDLINEFYGKEGARFITFVGLGMSVFTVCILTVSGQFQTSPDSPIPDAAYNQVFNLSKLMFVASMTAYLVGQLLDIQVFHFLRFITKEKMLWLRATGSTVISQLIDSLIVTSIAFSGKLPVGTIFNLALNNYSIKFLIAVCLTPLCYLGHAIIRRLIETHVHTTQEDSAGAVI